MSENKVWFVRMKAAQRDLIAACAGIERAADIAGVSSAHMGRMNSPNDAEIMPIFMALKLEADCGQAHVTKAMAEINGRRVSDADEEATAARNIMIAYSEHKRAAADLDIAFAEGAEDGVFSPAELTLIDRKAAKKAEAVSDFRAALAHGKAAGGVRNILRVVGDQAEG